MRIFSKTVLLGVVGASLLVAGTFAVVKLCLLSGKTPRTDQYVALRGRITRYSDSLRCTLGVAVVFDEGDTLTVGNAESYPMMSIVKLPLAISSCTKLDKEGRSLSEKCTLTKRNWVHNLWSPLRRGRRSVGTFTVEQLLEYMLAYSDNDVCQYFFDNFSSKEETSEFIRSLDIDGIEIPYDYRQISENQDRWNDVTSTPLATAQVLEYLYANRFDPGVNPVWEVMTRCRTGHKRIKAGIPREAAVAHKTGTSGNNGNGRLRCISDAAVVVLPDGRHFSLAVYVKDASFGKNTAARVIARVARMVYDEYSSKGNLEG